MAIRPKSQALSNIYYTRTKAGGKMYPQYCAELGSQGSRRIRIHATSLSECKKRIENWYSVRAKSGDAIAAFSMKQLADATLAFDALRKANIDTPLYDVVTYYIERCGGGIVKTRISDAYDAYYSHFTAAQEMTKKCVRARVGAFVAKHMNRFVSDITMQDVVRFLGEMDGSSPKTFNNYRDDISTFFNWCAKKSNNYCRENPVADIEKKKLKSKPPECASVDAVRELFSAVYNGNDRLRDVLLFRLALNYFGGVRVEEIKRMPTSDVRIDDGSIIVRDAKGTQTGKMSYRTFIIENCGTALGEWLKVVDFAKVDSYGFGETVYNKALLAAKAKCKNKFPNNAGRHSFISYHVAAFGNPQKTEGIVGTSEEMRKCNYQTLMTKADGESYFAITPASVCGTIKEKEESK